MKTTRILTIAVVLLLLINAAMLIFMLKQRKPASKGQRRGGPFEMMVKELNMSEQQQAEYKKMKEEHFNSVRPLLDSVRAAKQSFFNLAKEPVVNDSTVTAYSNRVAQFQSAADKQILDHFRKVRGLFKDEQQKKFDEFVQKMMQGRGRKDSSGRSHRP
jgi:periplasmic protein CpxP/Spy